MKLKKTLGVAILAAVVATGVQVMQPATVQAFDLGGALGGAVKKAAGVDEEGIQKTRNNMVDNYYKALLLSNEAAQVGTEIFNKYEVPVEQEMAAAVNSSTDTSDETVQKTMDLQVIKVKTELNTADQFNALAKKFAKDDPDIATFRMYKEAQKKALADAMKDTAMLIGKQALVGNASDAVQECIALAIWYNDQQSAFKEASGTSCDMLNDAIKKNCKVKVNKDQVKDAIANVDKG